MPAHLKSSSRKRLNGTDRRDKRPPKDFAARLTVAPRAPGHLSDRAKREWRTLSAAMVGIGTLTVADLRALELLAETLAVEAQLRDMLAASADLTIPAGSGGVKAHPALRALEAARAQARAMLADFGLTPKGRQSIDAAPPSKASNRFSGRGRDTLDYFRDSHPDGTARTRQ